MKIWVSNGQAATIPVNQADRWTKPGTWRLVLLDARKIEHRRIAVSVTVRNPETGDVFRVGVPRGDHASDWELRFARRGDLVEWTVGPRPKLAIRTKTLIPPPRQAVSIRHLGPPKHGLVPQTLARDWAMPDETSDILKCPFLLEQSHTARPAIMVIGDYPTTEIQLPDLKGAGYNSTIDAYAESLFSRADFLQWQSTAVYARSAAPPLYSFPDFLAGADDPTLDPAASIGKTVGGRAPYPVVYTWLSATPFVGRKRAYREVPTALKHDDGRVRHLVNAFQPDIIIVSGEAAIRRLGLVLRPLLDPMSDHPPPSFSHDLGPATEHVFKRDTKTVRLKGGDSPEIIPVYDLHFFGQDKSSLPAGYWSTFCAFLRDRIRARKALHASPKIMPTADFTEF